MLIIIRTKANDQTRQQTAEDFSGYIKVVVDCKRKILSAGGKRHADGEELLLKDGSKQEDLWGGGLDLETGEIDFDSMINIRPRQNNPSREVLSPEIREVMVKIILEFLK